jgi:hypothetical protein
MTGCNVARPALDQHAVAQRFERGQYLALRHILAKIAQQGA